MWGERDELSAAVRGALDEAWPALEPPPDFAARVVDLACQPELDARPGAGPTMTLVSHYDPSDDRQADRAGSRRGAGGRTSRWAGWAAAAALLLLGVVPAASVEWSRRTGGAGVDAGAPGEVTAATGGMASRMQGAAHAAMDARTRLAPELEDALAEHLRLYGREYGEAFRFHGVVLVGRGDDVIVTTAGTADVMGRRPTSEHTRYRIGSLTQQLVAVAIMREVERGTLGLDERLGRRWPEYEGPAREVTVRQLLSHTAGVPNVNDLPEWVDHKHEEMRTEELLQFFERLPLRFEPGTQFEPSNSNYILLGALLERLHDAPLADVLEREVFEPAGMTESSLGSPRVVGATFDVAEGKEFDEDEALSHATPISLSALAGAGGVVSTARDLWRFHVALHGGRLLGAEAQEEMYTPHMRGYGLGWVVERRHGLEAYSHPAGIDGFNASMVRFEDGTLVLALASTEVVDCQPLGYAVAELVYTGGTDAPREWTEQTLGAAEASAYLGSYALDDSTRRRYRDRLATDRLELLARIEIEQEDGHLWLRVPGYGRKWLHHHEGEQFFFKDRVGTTAEFMRGADGSVDRMVLREGTLEFELRRLPAR